MGKIQAIFDVEPEDAIKPLIKTFPPPKFILKFSGKSPIS